MRAHVFQHVPFEGLGSIANWLDHRSAAVSSTRWFAPDPQPPPPDDIDLLIVLGGPMSANDDDSLPWLGAERAAIHRAIESATPTLGICLGAQQIARALGARVFANPELEIGWWPLEPAAAATGPFADLFATTIDAFHWHGETFDLPAGATHLARSAACTHQAFSIANHVLALQFHLESTPAAARDLIAHCDDHTHPGRHVQDATTMLADPTRFPAANQLMAQVLDRLIRLAK